MDEVVIHWFRRDLRWSDNHALSQALASEAPVLPLFIFDNTILKDLPKEDARVEFIYKTLKDMSAEASVLVEIGKPRDVFSKLFKKYKIKSVYTNEDYEPQAILRDQEIASLCKKHGAEVLLFKDQVIFHKDECVKPNSEPYRVFTPYSKRWLALFKKMKLEFYPSERHLAKLYKVPSKMPSLEKIGFRARNIKFPEANLSEKLLKDYDKLRNRVDIDGTSRASLHLRFGTLSVRKAVDAGRKHPIWLNELIWREFFMMILFHFPQTVTEPARNPNLGWRTSKQDFEKWARGKTGYPIVDAAMRQLNETGYMHNRARLIVASFFCKHLLLHWKKGERYFAEKLLDFELSSNIGNWQWSAGTGFDAAPYFRIFNPYTQAKKFDPEGVYVSRWAPEYGTDKYPKPMVDHEMARRRALINYSKSRGKK
jgi:deoxyribodipyrimidine photo-lyase